ncbi:MAG: transcriptional regulator [Nitrosospira sp. 56-18]|jgi:DNA-binding XRE family transcriptional regulator|nr:helix-turn-helix transcriptional regulator [Nitrosospira sp.]OJY14357.1 MAG: transcriptional regulator [Nitrosospira sp. 56-18]
MRKIQFIETDGRRDYAIVPIEIFERMAEISENMDDMALYDAAKAVDDGTRIPSEVVNAELAGAHPIKAWRKYRNLTVQALADKAGISKPFLSQIEGRKRTGTIAVLSAIAKSLDVPVDLVTE